MASSGKQKTTTAKRVREARLRERRLEKQARKDARKQAAAQEQGPTGDRPGVSPAPGIEDPGLDSAPQAPPDTRVSETNRAGPGVSEHLPTEERG
jgi:hypothetical protein